MKRSKAATHPLPRTPAKWLAEIKLAIVDAQEAKPFGVLTGHKITDADLFHLAPLVALKFRGRNIRGPEAKRVTEWLLDEQSGSDEAQP